MEQLNTLNREIELLQLGFKKNYDQQAFCLYRYDVNWYVDFKDVYEAIDYDWECCVENLKFELSEAKKDYHAELLLNDAYNFAQKEFKKKLRDEYNKYNSWLQQETQGKIGRSPNFKRETELRAKVELLRDLINKL